MSTHLVDVVGEQSDALGCETSEEEAIDVTAFDHGQGKPGDVCLELGGGGRGGGERSRYV